MLKPELYQKTVDILVKAYFEDTLKNNHCAACAVGNIIVGANGYEFGGSFWKVNGEMDFDGWRRWWWLVKGFYSFGVDVELGLKEIKNTGYSVSELNMIEAEFEAAPIGNSKDERMFNGLMAVIDVLDQIHENTDNQVTATTKQRFQKC